jgi:hypothetical protein
MNNQIKKMCAAKELVIETSKRYATNASVNVQLIRKYRSKQMILKDKELASLFITDREATLDKFYEIVRRSMSRTPLKTYVYAFKEKVERGFFCTYNYSVDIVNDYTNYCSWMFVESRGVLDLEMEQLFGPEYVKGLLIKIPFLTRKEMIYENPVIKAALEKSRSKADRIRTKDLNSSSAE